MKSDKCVISLENVSKIYSSRMGGSHELKDAVVLRNRGKKQNKLVLKNMSFEVKKGESVGLIGQNGCGKSTTLKLLARIIRPNSGRVSIDGKVACLIELGAGFHPDMTGRENVYINASIFGFSRREIDARMDDIIAFSELGEDIDVPVRKYSSGMYLRLAFSVAINVDADILLIDEILAVGDMAFQQKCINRILELRRLGKTIILVSHSNAQVQSICDRAIWIEEGQIVEDGHPDIVCVHYMQKMKGISFEQIRKKDECVKMFDNARSFETEKLNVFDVYERADLGIDKRAEIISLETYSSNKIGVGDNFEFKLIFKAHEDLKHMYLRCIIRNIAYKPIGTTMTDDLGEYEKDQETTLKVVLDTSFLAPDNYILTIVLYDIPRPGVQQKYDSIHNAVGFTVGANGRPIYGFEWMGYEHWGPVIVKNMEVKRI